MIYYTGAGNWHVLGNTRSIAAEKDF
jgi:hypothetical protein